MCGFFFICKTNLYRDQWISRFQSASLLSLLCSQMVSEKVGGAEGTKLDEDFKDLERVKYKHTD